MDPIPDAWPPEDDAERPKTVVAPVFPLPGVFLFPGQVLPLHIFEPRYREMVEDCLDGPGRIAIAATTTTDASSDTPPLPSIAGLGEIARHDKLPDGRFMIWLGGVARVRIEELPSDRPYRRVLCEMTDEIAPPQEDAVGLRAALLAAIGDRVEIDPEVAGDLPIGLLADLLCQCIAMPRQTLAALFDEPDIAIRAERALEEHERHPKRPGDDA